MIIYNVLGDSGNGMLPVPCRCRHRDAPCAMLLQAQPLQAQPPAGTAAAAGTAVAGTAAAGTAAAGTAAAGAAAAGAAAAGAAAAGAAAAGAAAAGESAFGYFMALFDLWNILVIFVLEERKCIYLPYVTLRPHPAPFVFRFPNTKSILTWLVSGG